MFGTGESIELLFPGAVSAILSSPVLEFSAMRTDVAPGDITEAETAAWANPGKLPEIDSLIQYTDETTLEAAKKVLKDFRG